MARLVIGTDKTATTAAKVRDISPELYRTFSVDNAGKLVNSTSTPWKLLPSNVTDIGNYCFAEAYKGTPSNILSGKINLSSLTSGTGSFGMYCCFYSCPGITEVDLSNIKKISGNSIFMGCFQGCSDLTSVDLSSCQVMDGSNCFSRTFDSCTNLTSLNMDSLEYVNNSNVFAYTFYNCTNLTSVNLSTKYISGGSAFMQTFENCANLTSFKLDDIVWIVGAYGTFANLFKGCTSLTTFNMPKLCRVSGGSCFNNTFKDTAITSLSFPSLAYTTTNFNNFFQNMLQGCSNITVHFPTEWQTTMSSWSNITNGMGGTNTTVLFDLPNVTTLDLSHITTVNSGCIKQISYNNYFPNITKVDLSKLVSVDFEGALAGLITNSTSLTTLDLSSLTVISSNYVLNGLCTGCTSLTNLDLSSLTIINGTQSLQVMANGCTGLTRMDFYSLLKIEFSAILQQAFYNCTGLQSVYFHALTNTSFGTEVSQFNSMLQGVTGCTVHFPSNLQSVIGSWTSVTGGFGGTNTTVLFDLPATVILTGVNTTEYQRNPKYDTATALAWRIKDTGTNTEPIIDWTPFYTSGTTDPQVNYIIYSDSACTTAVTTISSIA